jgi:2-deoxy-D-gluconate 3-dehydrogenase
LASLGADIGIIQRAPGHETADAARAMGVRAAVAQADLEDPHAAADAVARLAESLGRLDACVCNAGVIHREPAISVSLEDWQRVTTVNLVSSFVVARAAARIFLESGEPGAIVLVASVLAFQGGLNVSSYAASKAGVANLARSLSNEWAQHGIRVNAVAPGYIENEQTRPVRQDPVRKREIDGRIPLGRWGDEREIGAAVAFLLGPDSTYLSGHTLVVDGGWLGR